MTTITEADADRSHAVSVGDEIAITLAENRTAGFQWSIDETTGGITVVSSEFEPAADARPGAGGRRRIVLRATHPGEGALRLRYQRSWEGEAGSARQCRFAFDVKSA